MRAQLPVEIVEHDAGLDHAGALLDIEREDAVEMFGEVDDDAAIDGLAALRGAAAARRDGKAVLARDARARSASSMVRGTTTPAGMIW